MKLCTGKIRWLGLSQREIKCPTFHIQDLNALQNKQSQELNSAVVKCLSESISALHPQTLTLLEAHRNKCGLKNRDSRKQDTSFNVHVT